MVDTIYTKKVVVNHCFIGWDYMDLTITGKVTKYIIKRWFRKPKEVFEIELDIPYIRNPHWVREKDTNRKLQCAADMLKYELKNYIISKYGETGDCIYYKCNS